MSKPEKKVQVEFVRQTQASGQEGVEVVRIGDVVTLPESEANMFITSGRAVKAAPGAKDFRQGKAKPAPASKKDKEAA